MVHCARDVTIYYQQPVEIGILVGNLTTTDGSSSNSVISGNYKHPLFRQLHSVLCTYYQHKLYSGIPGY
jgi:hypothetical protein